MSEDFLADKKQSGISSWWPLNMDREGTFVPKPFVKVKPGIPA